MHARVVQFYYHLGLHYSQTHANCLADGRGFYYHLGLHYSQTQAAQHRAKAKFYYHLGLHYSQTSNFKTAGISF